MGCGVNRQRERTVDPVLRDQLQTESTCPICGLIFSTRNTHSQLNSHIENCIRLRPLLTSIEGKNSVSLPPKRREGKKDPAHMSYESKCRHFRKQVNKVRVPWSQDNLVIVVNRANLIDNSLSQLCTLGTSDFHKEFGIFFEGEMGQDAGGLFKEWLNAVTAELFSAERGLFLIADCEGVYYRMNPETTDQSGLYELCGKVLAKAMFENVPINCPLATPIYRQLAGRKVVLKDLQRLDKGLYESLDFMKHNSVEGIVLNSFVVAKKEGKVVELKPGGAEVGVSEENKLEYVKLRKDWEVRRSVKSQLQAFLKGFHTVIPQSYLEHFDPSELELLMCGMPSIDVKEWEDFTVYRDEYHKDHPVIRWFWEILSAMTQDDLSKLLMFSMGTYRLPVEGFKTLKTMRGDTARFTLQPVDFEQNSPYPRAHTCFNRLDLPVYVTKEDMQHFLFTALNYSVGFGLE